MLGFLHPWRSLLLLERWPWFPFPSAPETEMRALHQELGDLDLCCLSSAYNLRMVLAAAFPECVIAEEMVKGGGRLERGLWGGRGGQVTSWGIRPAALNAPWAMWKGFKPLIA